MNIALFYVFYGLEIIFLFFMCLYGFGLVYSSIKGAPYVPTAKRQLNAILQRVQPKKNALFIELGSGDGRMLRRAVELYSVKGVGYDINMLLVIWSRFLSRRNNIQKKVSFFKKDIFEVDLRNADYLYFFLMPRLIDKLIPKMETELQKKALVISHGFKIPGWEKRLYDILEDKDFSTYYYRCA